jgi:hypothetical protein
VDGPYRESKPLADLIPPDRRRQKTAALVVVSMIAGVVLFQGGRWLLEPPSVTPAPPPIATATSRDTRVEPPPATSPGPLTQEEVERVIAAHRAAVKQACWDRLHADRSSAKVTLSIVVGANGDVVLAEASGSDALVAMCIENQARTWQFPAHGERSSTIRIPFVFTRS